MASASSPTSSSTTSPAYLTIEQAADRAQVSRNTVKAWTKEPGFPIIEFSPRLKRIPTDLFDIWMRRKLPVGIPAVGMPSQQGEALAADNFQPIENTRWGRR